MKTVKEILCYFSTSQLCYEYKSAFLLHTSQRRGREPQITYFSSSMRWRELGEIARRTFSWAFLMSSCQRNSSYEFMCDANSLSI